MNVTHPVICVASLVLVLSGCAVGEAPDAVGPGTRLHPHLKPDHKLHGRHAQGRHGPGKQETKPGSKSKSKPKPTAKPPQQTSRAAPSSSAASAVPAPGGSPSPSAPPTAETSDRDGDVQGLGAPSFADLTGATLTADGGYTLTVATAAGLPASSADKTMHVILFADVDGDGQIDYENWATLADNGWSGAWRYPDGAKFGSASGIHVTVSGSRLTMTFPADHVGNAEHFRWLVGAEYGSDAQMASGTQSSDYAPDNGSVDFPAR